MSAIIDLIRPHLRSIEKYVTARDEFTGDARVFLDANENSFGAPIKAGLASALHRYPDPLARGVRRLVAEWRGVPEANIALGNGSDELIELLIRAFCTPGQDSIAVLCPTYGMYRVAACIHDVSVIEVPLVDEFALDADALMMAVQDSTKIVFLCNPNNPTGNVLNRGEILKLLERFSGVLVIDEAYIDFCKDQSFLPDLLCYPRLVILQTFSKAWGLAGARCGLMFADSSLIELLQKIKLPYNLSTLTQRAVLEALRSLPRTLFDRVRELCVERERLSSLLVNSPHVARIYPSCANFLLVKTHNPSACLRLLSERGVIVRDRSTLRGCEGCLRITVGTRAENNSVLEALGVPVAVCASERTGEVRRETSETEIVAWVSLDGQGRTDLRSGVPFLDHMLDQLARHSGLDLSLYVRGDLEVDAHHSIEDTALVIGEAIRKALGDKRGIERYGFVLPLDEAKTGITLDLSGRPYLKWSARFSGPAIGAMPTEMIQHFFYSMCQALGATLHVEASGENDHHICESIFKCFARTLKQAISRGTSAQLPSTKGVL